MQTATGRRWIRGPVAASLEIGGEHGLPEIVLGIELLEVVRGPLRPDVTFGVVHLSARVPDDGDAMLRCSRLLSTRWRDSASDGPTFAVVSGVARTVLLGHEPLRALAIHLFGDAHPNVMHRAHIFVAARLPPGVALADEPAWRRAIGRGHTLERAAAMLSEKEQRDDDRTERIGGATATFFGRSTALTHRLQADDWVYNVRSYWSEAVLFALIQQSYLETYAKDLGRMGGDPLSKRVEDLFRDWVAFRNVLWWRELSYRTDMPRRLLVHVHRDLNTDALFGELERAFATYVEARRHRTEDAERAALRGLQVYGAAFAVVSATAAVTQIATAEALGSTRWTVYALAITLGAIAALVTRALLRWRER
jgi:hypothetical protein